MLFCQFCGTSNCEDCLFKERQFPRAQLQVDGSKKKGQICKLCDRKFYLRQLTIEQAISTSNLRKFVSKFEQNVNEAKDEQMETVQLRDNKYYANQKKLKETKADILSTVAMLEKM